MKLFSYILLSDPEDSNTIKVCECIFCIVTEESSSLSSTRTRVTICSRIFPRGVAWFHRGMLPLERHSSLAINSAILCTDIDMAEPQQYYRLRTYLQPLFHKPNYVFFFLSIGKNIFSNSSGP